MLKIIIVFNHEVKKIKTVIFKVFSAVLQSFFFMTGDLIHLLIIVHMYLAYGINIGLCDQLK